MNRTIHDIANLLLEKNIPFELGCPERLKLSKMVAWDDYETKGALTFYTGTDVDALNSKSDVEGCIIVKSKLKSQLTSGNYVFTPNPHLAFIYIAEMFKNTISEGVHASAVVSTQAKLGQNVSVGPGSVIGAAAIGDNTVIGNGVMISDACEIGNGVTILSGANLGEAGLGSIMDNEGNHVLFPHLGKLIIKDNVTIGAGTIINGGSLKDTVIEENTHISGQCFIAHNCHIGERSYLAAGASLAGSVAIGKRCYLGMRCLIKEGVTVPDEVTIGMGVEIHKTIKESGITMVSSNKPKNIGNMFSLKRK